MTRGLCGELFDGIRTLPIASIAHSGADLAELKFVLGHSQIAHTVDLYGHLVPGRLEGLRTTFDAAVSAAQQPAGADPAGRRAGAAPAAPGDVSARPTGRCRPTRPRAGGGG